MRFAVASHLYILLAVVGILLVTAWIYAPALEFGFIWDDPLWFNRIVGKSLWDIVKPMPDFQFYRPGTMLYNRLFLRPNNTFDAWIMHASQIGWHLLNVALVFALSRRLGLGKWAAVAAAALVAFHPFSYQAVAWTAPQQPPVTALQNSAWLLYLSARRGRRRCVLALLSLGLFLLALISQESTVALAGFPLLIEWGLYRRRGDKTLSRFPWLALTYLLAAAVFGLLWLQAPRHTNLTKPNFDLKVLGYLAQGFIFPLIGWPQGYGPGRVSAPAPVLALVVIVVSGLAIASWRTGQSRLTLVGALWALLGIAPTAFGLRYTYVSLGSRLFYPATPGVALLWICTLLPPANHSRQRRLWRTVGVVLLCLIIVQSSLLLSNFQHMYAVGTAHLNELIQTSPTENDRLLFINFPDRYTPKRPPYPIGYWGVTLAPISVDLGTFPAITNGQHPQTVSRCIPWIGAEAREASPYRTDMRGDTIQADKLYELARQMDAVYLSRYHADGTLELQWAGAMATTSTQDCKIATFGQTLCLQEAQVKHQSDRLNVTLTWRSLSPAQPHDTTFVHVVSHPDLPPLAQADGDVWLGMLPLPALEPGDTIQEQRIITVPEETLPTQYEIRVGIYNRLTGQRLPATTPQGTQLPDNAATIYLCNQSH